MAAMAYLNQSLTTEMAPSGGNMTTCAIFGGVEQLCQIVIGVKKFLAAISVLGCATTIFFIWLFRQYLIFIQRLILYLFIATLLKCISFLVESRYDPGPACTFQAWTLSYFSWAVLLWNVCITFTLYMTALRSTKTHKLEWVYHAVSWGLPFIIACLPLFGSHYGPAGLWCWIKDDWGWRFGTLYLPLVILLPLLLGTYIYIMVTVNKQSKTWEGHYEPDIERKKKLLREELKPLRWYPVIHLASWVFPFINRTQNAASSQRIFALIMLHIISSTLYGITLSVLFFLSKEMRGRMTKAQIQDAFYTHRRRDKDIIREYDTQQTSVAVVSVSVTEASATEASVTEVSPSDISPSVLTLTEASPTVYSVTKSQRTYGGETDA